MPRRIGRRARHVWLSPRLWVSRVLFWAGAVVVASAAILLAVGTEYANIFYHRLIALSPYLPLALLPMGLALISILTRRFFPGSQGSGIPQAIAAVNMTDAESRDAVLSLRIAIGKIGLTLLGLAAGASVGREGPTVQIGASIMHALGRLERFGRKEMEKALILAGGAAGVAAAFNTPLAGVVFAIEEMSRSFEERTSGTVLTAVIIAGITSVGLLGNYTYFGRASPAYDILRDWPAILLCGTAGGLLGGVFSRILIGAARAGLPGGLGVLMRRYPTAFAALCGLVLAAIGIASESATYGTGYTEARQIIEGSQHVPQSFGLLKMLATIVSYVSGIPGGIFSPSLAVGAGLGQNLSVLLPQISPSAVVLLGMVAYFAGVVQAPITAFVIVVEMIGDQTLVIPLMASSVVAYGASRLVCPEPIYKALAQTFLQRSTHHRVEELPPSA